MQYEITRKTQKSILRVRDGMTSKGMRTLVGFVETLAEAEHRNLILDVDGADTLNASGRRFMRAVEREMKRLQTSVRIKPADALGREASHNAAPILAEAKGDFAPSLRFSISAC